MALIDERAMEDAYHRVSAQNTFGEFVSVLLQVSCDAFSAKAAVFADAVRGETWRFEVADSLRPSQPMRVQPGAPIRFGMGDDLNAPFFDGPRPYGLGALGSLGARYGWLYIYDTDVFDDLTGRERFESFAIFAGAVLQNIRSLEAAQRAAVTDALTNLPNRRAIEEHVFEQVRQKNPFTYVLIDVDHFKSINDTYGHDGGDHALQVIAEALRAPKRRDDFVGRLGGDEFVAICTGDGARPLITRARQLLADPDPVVGAISISAGFASYPTDGDHAQLLYKMADNQMFKEKGAHHASDNAEDRRLTPPVTK